ncbi:MAG: hypothetical protein EB051_00840 [Chlamydiia bacterium]|nr:hypothetical protein [Chlamydiia bacterium]
MAWLSTDVTGDAAGSWLDKKEEAAFGTLLPIGLVLTSGTSYVGAVTDRRGLVISIMSILQKKFYIDFY